MEIREYALGLLRADSLEGKFVPPPATPTDEHPGEALRVEAPARPAELVPVARAPRVPPRDGMHDPAQRARILHAFANHELQAVEIFAWALLAFPSAPAKFRRGLLGLIADEQRHLRLYVDALGAVPGGFGSLPVNAYFWGKLDALTTPLAFVCSFCLVFENANLDHCLDYAGAARDAGELETAAILERVHLDEQRHVAFGLTWLKALMPKGADALETWRSQLQWPLRPQLARGRRFYPEAREGTGLDAGFLACLAAADDESGAPS